jgi:hypothetical protein
MQVEIQLAGKPNRWVYQQRRIRIGRDLSCDISLPSAEYPMVSREHVVLEFNEGVVRLLDSRSENGTYQRGVRISSGILHSGDSIRLGLDGPELQIRIAARSAQTASTGAPARVPSPEMAANSATAVSSPTVIGRALPAIEAPTVFREAPDVSGDASCPAPLVEPSAEPVPSPSRPHEVRVAFGNVQEAPPQAHAIEAASASRLQQENGDLQGMERMLKGIYTLLKVNLVAVLLLMIGLLYTNQQLERTRKSLAELRRQAQSAVGQFQPELDLRMKTLDARLDSLDGKMKNEEDHFVQRMDTEIPAMLDKYIGRKLSDAKHNVPAVRP